MKRKGKEMLTLLFIILLLIVFGKLLGFAIKASWGILKILFTVIFLPVLLILLVVVGLMYVALPVLLILGVVAVAAGKR